MKCKSQMTIGNKQFAPSEKMRTAVVGAGKMGAIHAKVYDQLPQSELVAVVDIDVSKAERLAEQYNCLATTSCVDILEKVDGAWKIAGRVGPVWMS